MTHSGLGYIFENGYIKLPHDILRPLSIRYNSSLWGIYYPKSAAYETMPESNLTEAAKHDYMITPVPPALWLASARVILKLNRGKGVMGKISEFFCEKKISIVHSKSSRSSHRFSTWTLHIVFEDLLHKKLTYDETKGCYTEIENITKSLEGWIIKLHDKLKKEKRPYTLLFDKYDKAKSVEAYPNFELHFFHSQLANGNIENQPFPIRVSEDGELFAEGINDFSHQLKKVSESLNEDNRHLLDTCVFAEFDSRGLNIRLFIFPQNVKAKFFEIGIKYIYIKKATTDYTCLGLISSITNCLAKNKYNIWNSSNYATGYDESSEKGKLIYLVEDVNENRKRLSPEERLKEIKNLINKSTIIDKLKNPQIEILEDIIITQLNNFKIKRKLDRISPADYKYDVFISFSLKDDKLATKIEMYFESNGLKCAKSTNIKSGIDFYQAIGEDLRTSREMVLLYTNNYYNSDWRKAEQGSFWAFNRIINPILMHDISYKKLDSFINRSNAIKLANPKNQNFETDFKIKLNKLIDNITERKGEDILELFERDFDK
jgi:hypothetical protein